MIDSLRRDIENLFLMAKGYQKTMICSDNEYVDYIADFIINIAAIIINIPSIALEKYSAFP